MRPNVRRATAVAVLVVASALALPASGDDLIACSKLAPGAIDVRKDGWAKIRFPLHTSDEGPAGIVSFATSPGFPNRMFSTNGHVIKTTANAGCTWQTIFRGNQPQPPSQSAEIDVDVFTHVVAPANDTLWLAAYDDNRGVPKPRVYVLDLGDDANNAEPPQTTVDNGLPPVGTPADLQVTPGVDASAYLLVEGAADGVQGVVRKNRLFTTYVPTTPPQAAAVGAIWKEVVPPDSFGEVGGMRAVRDQQLLVWSGGDFAVTQDSLADEIDWKTGSVQGEIVDAVLDRDGVATLVVKGTQGMHGVLVDTVDGRAAGSVSFPVAPTSIVRGERSGVIAVSSPKGTYGYDVELKEWVNITPKGAKQPFTEMFMANAFSGARYLIGLAADGLWRFDTFDWELFRAPPPLDFFGDLNFGTVPRSTLKNLVLSPRNASVTIQPGKLHREPVNLKVPPDPNKLDVFFMVDTTGSMQPAIDGLRKNVLNIAEGLRTILDQPKEVCFGVGDVKDESGTGGPTTSGGDLSYIYRTRQKVVCESNPELPLIKGALGELHANIGGNYPEAQTIGLVQAIKGTGMGRPGSYYVAPNQDAGFRPDALKVIVLITDAYFNKGGSYPTISEAAETLNSSEVKFVGVHTLREYIPETKADLTEMAIGTRTFAPAEGVDCDGDGKHTKGIDLKPGDPLVCQTDGANPNIGGAVLGLLMGVQDPGTIAVHVGDEDNVVQEPIDGKTVAIRNLKRESHLDFTLPLMCTKKQDGKDLTVKLLPSVRAKPYNPLGTITVKCRAQVIPPPPPPVVEEPPAEVALKPRPKPQLAIPIQPPPQPPPITNVNLNAGFSQQEEQQFQVATVTQDAVEDDVEEEVELAMTGLDRQERDVAGAAVTFAGAAMLSAAAGVAYRRRLQRSRRVQHVTVR